MRCTPEHRARLHSDAACVHDCRWAGARDRLVPMRNLRWSLAGGLLACGLPVACADPCVDDGLGQDDCPTQNESTETDGQTDSIGNTDSLTDTVTVTVTDTDAMTDSQTATETVGETLDGTETDTATATETETATATETDTASETDTDTDTAGGTLWCVDADGDGFGDPTMCQQSDDMPPGTVDNDDDCNDGSENTFPGAAPNDDRRACMQDEDDDGWGDSDPPPGVDPGTDCTDEDAAIFPGAAINEMPPDLCAQDQDGDGWGDTDPPPGVDPGNDCADDDVNIFPGAAEEEPELCAEDQDDDGWGDFDPPPGVDPGTDCADESGSIFPGAAPLDDATACMQDEDGDDWGDDVPPPGVEVGTDCDDTNPDAFPGAAPNENPPNLCTIDTDGDGWGDANPGGGGGGGTGPQGGSDCYDANPQLNPDTLQLTAILPFNGAPVVPRTLQTVDPATAALAPFVTLQTAMGTIPNVNLVTATMSEAGEILANDLTSNQLYTIDYEATCDVDTGVVTGLGTYDIPAIPELVCGLEFGGDGTLYGVDNGDVLVTFDPATGAVTSSIPITLGMDALNISSCGMAYDCAQDRLLIANGINQSIYSVDPVTGAATLVRDLDPFFGPAWNPVGLAWDAVSRNVYLSTGGELWLVNIDDDTVDPVQVGMDFPQQVSNLQYLPICSP